MLPGLALWSTLLAMLLIWLSKCVRIFFFVYPIPRTVRASCMNLTTWISSRPSLGSFWKTWPVPHSKLIMYLRYLKFLISTSISSPWKISSSRSDIRTEMPSHITVSIPQVTSTISKDLGVNKNKPKFWWIIKRWNCCVWNTNKITDVTPQDFFCGKKQGTLVF